MLTVLYALATLATTQIVDKPITIDASGKRLKLSNSVELQCPISGRFSIRFSSDNTNKAFATELIGYDRKLSDVELNKLNAWLAVAGSFEYSQLGCAGDAALVKVTTSKIVNGRGGRQVLTFAIRRNGLVKALS